MFFCPFAAQNTMLAIFPALLRIFSPEHFSSCSGFRCLSANFSPIFCWRFFFFSKAILSLLGAVIAQFGRQFDENVRL
jgi:hypothetical protein